MRESCLCSADYRPCSQRLLICPLDPSRSKIQQHFRDTLLQPDPFALHLSELRNQSNAPFGVQRLQIDFRRPDNLANNVAPNRFTSPTPISLLLPPIADTTVLAPGAGSPTTATTSVAAPQLSRTATLPPPMAALRLPYATALTDTCLDSRTPDF